MGVQGGAGALRTQWHDRAGCVGVDLSLLLKVKLATLCTNPIRSSCAAARASLPSLSSGGTSWGTRTAEGDRFG